MTKVEKTTERLIGMAVEMKQLSSSDDIVDGFKESIYNAALYASRVEDGVLRSRQVVAGMIASYEAVFRTIGKVRVYCIARNSGETTLNEKEYLLDNKDNVMVFASKDDASQFLIKQGIDIHSSENEFMSIEEYNSKVEVQ